MRQIVSKDGIRIRLTAERVGHILKNHPEMLEYIFDLPEVIADPDYIFKGKKGEFLAVKGRKEFYLVVVYKEDLKKKDGFVITYFKTKNINYLLKKELVWKKP